MATASRYSFDERINKRTTNAVIQKRVNSKRLILLFRGHPILLKSLTSFAKRPRREALPGFDVRVSMASSQPVDVTILFAQWPPCIALRVTRSMLPITLLPPIVANYVHFVGIGEHNDTIHFHCSL